MITLYKCEFCRDKEFKNKTECRQHEAECVDNPAYKCCNTCGVHWRHQEPDETWYSCDKKLMTYKSSRGDWMKNCEGWEPEVNRRKL